LVLDDIDNQLDGYGKKFREDREKTARINKILFIILIIVVIVFSFAVWGYHTIH